jgi:hypothetical protein
MQAARVHPEQIHESGGAGYLEDAVEPGPVDVAVHQQNFGPATSEGGREVGGHQGFTFPGRRTGNNQRARPLAGGERQTDPKQAEGFGLLRQCTGRAEDQLVGGSPGW